MKRRWLAGIITCTLLNVLLFPAVSGASEREISEAKRDARSWLLQAGDRTDDWGAVALYSIDSAPAAEAAIAREQTARSTDVQRKLLAYLAAGASPRDKVVRGLIEDIVASQREDGKFADAIDGSGGELINAHIWGILALYGAGEPIPNRTQALKWLVREQNGDGGFGIDVDSKHSDVDMTAMALLAFHALQQPVDRDPVRKALDYLKEKQLESGGFPSMGVETSESTAVVIQALAAYGIDESAWHAADGSPADALLNHQLSDGSFAHVLRGTPRPNMMATTQALMALGDIYHGQSWLDRLRKDAVEKRLPDVSTQHEHYDAIVHLLYEGVMSGFPDGSFRPDETLTRAQLMKMIVDAKGEKASDRPITRFSDLPPDHWANPYVARAYDRGWVRGIDAEHFAPDRSLTVAQAAAIILRSMDLEHEAKALREESDPWYGGYVRYAANRGWLDASLSPEKPITRAQTAALIRRALYPVRP